MPRLWAFVVIVSIAVGVFLDARRIGVRRGVLPGLGAMGPVGWSAYVLWFLPVALPTYVVYRFRYLRARARLQEGLQDRRRAPRWWAAVPSVACAVVLNLMFFVLAGLAGRAAQPHGFAAPKGKPNPPALQARSAGPAPSPSRALLAQIPPQD